MVYDTGLRSPRSDFRYGAAYAALAVCCNEVEVLSGKDADYGRGVVDN